MLLQENLIEHAIWLLSRSVLATVPAAALHPLTNQLALVKTELVRLYRRIVDPRNEMPQQSSCNIDALTEGALGEAAAKEVIMRPMAKAFFPDEGMHMLRDVEESEAQARLKAVAQTSIAAVIGTVLIAVPEPFITTLAGGGILGSAASELALTAAKATVDAILSIPATRFWERSRKECLDYNSLFFNMSEQVDEKTLVVGLHTPSALIMYVLWRLSIHATRNGQQPVFSERDTHKPQVILFDYCLKRGYISQAGMPIEKKKAAAASRLNYGWKREYSAHLSWPGRRRAEEKADQDVYNAVMRVCALEAFKRRMQKLSIPIIAVVGKQNAGKSTLISKLTGETVPDIAFDKHTANESLYLLESNLMILDTPGLGTADMDAATLQQRIQLSAEAGMFKAVIAVTPLLEGRTDVIVDFLNNLEQGVHVLLCLSHAGRLDDREIREAINDKWDSTIKDAISRKSIKVVPLESKMQIDKQDIWGPEQVKRWITETIAKAPQAD